MMNTALPIPSPPDVTAGGPLQMTPLILMLIILVGLLAYPWLAKKPIGWGARDPE